MTVKKSPRFANYETTIRRGGRIALDHVLKPRGRCAEVDGGCDLDTSNNDDTRTSSTRTESERLRPR